MQEFNKYYYWLSEIECFLLPYSRMIVSYSGYPERSVSNQLSVMETSNTNKKNYQHKFAVHSFRKELQQNVQTDNYPPRQILDEIDKENYAAFVKQIYNYRLSSDSNSFDPYKEIIRSVKNKKKVLTTVQMKASHSFEKLHFARPENLQ